MDEVGKKLREARIDKGYTIDDLQQITKIQKRYLIAIEEGNFDALPGDFYVRAFIKQYAETVGLDGQKLLDQYSDELPQSASTTAAAEEEEQQPTDKRREARPLLGASTVTARAKNYLPQIIIVAVVTIIIIILSYFTWRGTQGNKRAIPSTEATSSEVAKSSSKETSSSAKSSSAKSSSKKKESSKKELKITAAGVSGSQMNYTVTDLPDSGNKITVAASTQAVWLAVSFGNVQSWQGTLQAGADHTVEVPSGTQSIQIRTGNATYTTAKLNDQTIDMNQAGVTSIVRTANLTISGAAATSSDQSGAASSSSDAGQD